MLRRFVAALSIAALMLVVPGRPAAVLATTGTYYFHGTPTDDVDKANGLSNATFSATPPTGTVPITQSTTAVANQDYIANLLTAYWHGPFTGTVQGQLVLDWWWTAPAATSVAVTVFADPDYAAASPVQPERIIGRGVVPIAAGAPAESHGAIWVNGTVAHELLIQVAATSLITGNGIRVDYDATLTPSSFQFVSKALPTSPGVVFDTTSSLAFAPSTTVSATFFGAEPQTTIERPIAVSQLGRVDANRVFVNWPLSSRTGIGQESRSLDGGDTFRLLYDRTCAERSRPQCDTEGGGDTEDTVNLVNGDVLFADQEVVANEALASSTDHGDTWPLARSYAISNAGTAVDRQWLDWVDPSLVSVAGLPVDAFFSYHVPAVGVYVIAVTTDGVPVVQPAPQLLDVSQSSNLRVDNTHGPARGWIYVPYRNTAGYEVATAPAAGYAQPSSWQSTLVTTDQPAIFPWLNLDAHGNAYAVWVTNGIVYLSISPIDDPRNDPALGGRPATYWTTKTRVSLPAVGSAVFPEVTAGDTGRIAITYVGSTDCTGVSDGCPNEAHWSTYVTIATDALALTRGTSPTLVTGLASHRIVHRGQVCTSGTTCSGDRSLLDMTDLGFDDTGRVGVVFMDNNNGVAANPRTAVSKNGPFTQFAKEVAGPSLLASRKAKDAAISVAIPENGRTDASGDATWPNTSGGTNIAALDLLGASVYTSGTDLVARIPLADSSRAGLASALSAYNAVPQSTPPADRLQYVFRFSTAEDVFHLSMEYNSDGTVRFFGGKLDGNDGVSNGTSVLGTGYHTDAAYPVVGTLDRGTLTLRAPLASFGLAVGDRITGAAAFAMAGPSEQLEQTIADVMRTVDATPPFDATLGPQQDPPRTVDCRDQNVQSHGGWAQLSDSRAGDGSLCRNVGTNKSGSMSFQFTGTALDLTVATGPRGNAVDLTVDGATQTIDLYRAPTDPAHLDNTGRQDLTFVTVHQDVPAGIHTATVSLHVTTDPYRDMAYVDGFTITGGDILTPAGHTATETVGTVLGTALAGGNAVQELVLDPSAQAVDLVVEAVAGTTITLTGPTGNQIASATVDDGGVVDLYALATGPGAYLITVHDNATSDLAFSLWEAVAENR